MIKRFYFLAVITVALLFAGCSEDITPVLDGNEDTPEIEGRVITLSTAMPDDKSKPNDGVQSRIALEQDGKVVKLTWEETDEIELSFIQGDKQFKETVRVDNISIDGKEATFSISVPTEIEGAFTLYGVYGGGGIDESDHTKVRFPQNAGEAQSLASVQSRKDVMLYFKEELNTEDELNPKVTFEHLGSLFSITIKNVGTEDLTGLAEARLTSTATGWAYNAGAGGNTYDMKENTFSGTSGDYLSFAAPRSTLESADSITFWAWYPPLPDATWPALSLQLLDADEKVLATSSNSKDARTAPTQAGMSYYFYALWDSDAGTDGNLQFTNSDYDGVFFLTVGGQFFARGLTRYYPNFIKDLSLYEDYLDVYALISLKDRKTYSMDYFSADKANTANIDMRLSVSTGDSRTVARNAGTFNNQYTDSEGKNIDHLIAEDRVITNTTGFKRLDIENPGFDFINATAATIGTPANTYYQGPGTSNSAYVHNGMIIGFKTASTSTLGVHLGVMKEVKRIQLPAISGHPNTNTYKLVVYAIKII